LCATSTLAKAKTSNLSILQESCSFGFLTLLCIFMDVDSSTEHVILVLCCKIEDGTCNVGVEVNHYLTVRDK
jgi:hypothetical protein